jgi:hypothetical protein
MFLTSLLPNKKTPLEPRRSFAFLPPILLLAAALAYFSLPLVGHWLVREDPIRSADAIAVLAGNFPQRAVEAAQLYESGYAPQIWLTRPMRHTAYAEDGRIVNTEDDHDIAVLRSFGVPETAIHILDAPIVNTADELNAIESGLKESGINSVIIVTNKAHTRRVYSLWEKYHAKNGEVLIHAVSSDPFPPSRWWLSAASRTQAMHEVLGMLDLWAGLPLHRPLPTNPQANAG